MLFAKAAGVALPDGVIAAPRRMYEAQVGRYAQSETCPRRPQAPVEVTQVKAVEPPGVERNGLQHTSSRGQENAVEDRDIAGDSPVIEQVDLPLRVAR